jgi:predicted nucleic acid-binding protein
MSNDLFLDTSGLYAYMVSKDSRHKKASASIRETVKARRYLVTTDYIIDETATLLKFRGYGHVASSLFDSIISSKACRVEWMDMDNFDKTRALFLKYNDHEWSFTDCFSFVVMKSCSIKNALTKDAHFREAGFMPILC